MKQGYIQVYTGDGKGKTTAALGLAIRAAGHGMRIKIIQFMKGRYDYGELQSLKRFPEIILMQFGRIDFVQKGQEQQIDFEEASAALKAAQEALEDKELDILILDEINVALYFGLLKSEDVINLMEKKPSTLELILTGRRVPNEIAERAHLITRMEEVRHYYNTHKLQARLGIEY